MERFEWKRQWFLYRQTIIDYRKRQALFTHGSKFQYLDFKVPIRIEFNHLKHKRHAINQPVARWSGVFLRLLTWRDLILIPELAWPRCLQPDDQVCLRGSSKIMYDWLGSETWNKEGSKIGHRNWNLTTMSSGVQCVLSSFSSEGHISLESTQVYNNSTLFTLNLGCIRNFN